MPAVHVVHGRAARDLDAIRQLVAAAEAVDGHPALNEAVWRDLDHDDGALHALAMASSHAVPAGYAHASRSDNEAEPAWEAGFVVAPPWRAQGVEDALLDAIVEGVSERGGGRLVLWRLGADRGDDALAARTGFHPARTLLEMRIPLPLGVSPVWPPDVEVRTFVPGRDEARWVAANNRAFAGHPEQGGWTEGTIRDRIAEPWFDPEGFLLAERGADVAGFCWTKVHEPEGWGEIYVIGVDPAHAGGGLGRALVVAGLDHLARRGLATGILFVDAANDAAVGLYRSLGFESVRADRAYQRDVESDRRPSRKTPGDPE